MTGVDGDGDGLPITSPEVADAPLRVVAGRRYEPNALVVPAAGVTTGGDYGLDAFVTNDGSELVYFMDFLAHLELTVGGTVELGTFVPGFRIADVAPGMGRPFAYTLGDVRTSNSIIIGAYTVGQGVAPDSYKLGFVSFGAHAADDLDFECYGLRIPLVSGLV